jgi:hypothetical protein
MTNAMQPPVQAPAAQHDVEPTPIKPVRTLRHRCQDGLHTLTISVPKGRKVSVTRYHLERLATDFGEGFRLTKFDDEPLSEGQDPANDVLLSPPGHTCDCRGFVRWAHCKHLAALLKLKELGRI